AAVDRPEAEAVPSLGRERRLDTRLTADRCGDGAEGPAARLLLERASDAFRRARDGEQEIRAGRDGERMHLDAVAETESGAHGQGQRRGGRLVGHAHRDDRRRARTSDRLDAQAIRPGGEPRLELEVPVVETVVAARDETALRVVEPGADVLGPEGAELHERLV